jgi:hypothetical protein
MIDVVVAFSSFNFAGPSLISVFVFSAVALISHLPVIKKSSQTISAAEAATNNQSDNKLRIHEHNIVTTKILAMINATDLTTIEVRDQYVKPLILKILAKTNLSRQASTLLGIHYCPTSTSTADDVHSATNKTSTCNDEKVIGTLYQEIELYKDEFTVDDDGDSSSQNANTYAQVGKSHIMMLLASCKILTTNLAH